MSVKIRNLFPALLIALVPHTARADAVADAVQAEMARSKTPGVAIAAVHGGRLVRAQGFGLANLELTVPAHPDTMYKVGPTGMQITAAAVMLLVEDGKLQLDAPVTRYLPGAPRKWSKVTIRHLLDHTSGLPTTPNGDFGTDYTPAELLAIIAGQDINFPAGTRWRFSYSGYIVLGYVIEQVTGEHWSRFAERRLFKPLGMHSARGIDETAIIPNRATGYEIRDGALRNAQWISAAANSTADGSLYLSVLDYAAWAQALSQRHLLSPQSWDELARPAKLGNGATCAYAPGWYRESRGGEEAWWQSGSWQGFRTYALRYPGKDLTVVVFANGEGAEVGTLAHQVAAALDPELARAPARPLPDADGATTAKARALIEAIAAGRADRADYADFALLDFNELAALNAGMIKDLGALDEIALFDTREDCGQTNHRFRLRYSKGMVEVRLGLTGDGKVNNLEIAPINAWDEPL